MKNKSIPIQWAREISERYGWPEVLIIALDHGSGKAVGTSYGMDRKHCAEAGGTLDEVMSKMGWARDADD